MDIQDKPANAGLEGDDSLEPPRRGLTELAPPDVTDPVIEVYKKDVDRSLLIKNLGLTPAQRAERLVDFVRFLEEFRRAGRQLQEKKMITDYARLLEVLSGHAVEFIVIGGVAANLHGSARATFDLDLVYARNPANIARLAKALGPYNPYLRGAPPGLPFKFDEPTIRNGLNFTLDTSLGDLDLLGEVIGGGNYQQLLPHTVEVEVFGIRCKCVKLERLIQLKRAAGRPKDLESIAELQALLEETRKQGGI